MDTVEEIEECCEVASSALDGKYGWQNETIALILFVIVFNFFAKWVLGKLHHRFERQRKIWKDSFVQALYIPLSTYTWFFVLIHVATLISPQTMADIRLGNMHLILTIAAIISIAWFALRWKKKLIHLTTLKSKRHEITWEHGKIDVIDKAITVILIFVTILVIMEATGRNISTLIAFGGIGGLAIAFASQEVIANFFSGLMIYLTHPFGVGDWIHLPERKLEGYVEEIGWYTTRIRTFEKRPLYVPNSVFSKSIVETPSRMSHRQFKEIIQLRYQDMKELQPIIEDILKMLRSHPEIDKDQRITVFLEGFGTYSLDIEISAYTLSIETEDFAAIKQDLLFKVIEILAAHNAEMAVPTTIIEMPKGIILGK